MRYVVKIRRTYGNREVTSVLCAPTTLDEATKILQTKYELPYQTTKYYIEQWKEGE